MSKTPINKPIFLAHTSRYHSATHSTYPLFSYLRSMKNIMQHIVPRKQPQRKVQSSSEVYVCPVSATSQNPITSFHILNSALTHTFSAKEKDIETGLSYFGSRYYSSDLSIWLSVDPMAHKYPSLSPYVYCANNPIKLVDPNGETWVDADGNEITDHSKIKVYIFYDPKSFDKQSRKMYKAAEKNMGSAA